MAKLKKRIKRKVGGKAKGVKYVRSAGVKSSPSSRMNLALRDLIFFAVLAFLSFLLKVVLTGVSDSFTLLFSLLAIVFGFIAFAFLVVLLILLFVKFFRK